MKEKREQNVNGHYSILGIIILLIFFAGGIYLIISSDILLVNNKESLINVLNMKGNEILFGLIFTLISTYGLVLTFLNICVKPKKDVLYLYENTDEYSIFINKKGKRYKLLNCKKEEHKYYNVLRTHDLIYDVLDECKEIVNENWSKNVDTKYWSNFYSTSGGINDTSFVITLYFGLIFFIILTLIGVLLDILIIKIIGITIGSFIIIYLLIDIVYKIIIRRKPELKENISLRWDIYSDNIDNSMKIIRPTILLIIFTIILFNIKDRTTVIMFLPFFFTALILFLGKLSSFLGKTNLVYIFNKVRIIPFLVFWFGMLFISTIYIFKNEFDLLTFLFLIPFWLAGFYLIYKLIIKK